MMLKLVFLLIILATLTSMTLGRIFHEKSIDILPLNMVNTNQSDRVFCMLKEKLCFNVSFNFNKNKSPPISPVLLSTSSSGKKKVSSVG